MGTAASTRTLRGFLVQWPTDTSNIWTAQAAYTQHTAVAGTPQASGSYGLGIQTGGTQAADITVKTQQGGHTGKARYIWRDTPAGLYYGKQQNNIARHVEVIGTGSASISWIVLDSFTAVDGTHYVATRSDNGAGTYGVTVFARAADSGTWTSQQLYSTTVIGLMTNMYAGLCQTEDGAIICGHWVRNTGGTQTQLRVLRTTDKGAAWTEIASAALESAVDTGGVFGAGANGYDVNRIRLRSQNGQILMIAQLYAHNTSLTQTAVIGQWGSISEGTSFSSVGITNGAITYFQPDLITTQDGRFMVIYIESTDTAKGLVLPNAFTPVSSAKALAITNPDVVNGTAVIAAGTVDGHFANGQCSVFCSPDGVLYACFEYFPDPDRGIMMVTSSDYGATWQFMGSGTNAKQASVWSSETLNYRLRNIAATWSAGGGMIAHNWKSTPSSFEDSAAVLYCGGYSQVTYPRKDEYSRYYEGVRPDFYWSGLSLPDAYTALTATGAGSATLAAGYVFVTTTTANQKFWTDTLSSGAFLMSQGCIVRLSFRSILGGSTTSSERAVKVQVSDGSTVQYSITAFVSPSQIRLIDTATLGALGTLTIDTTIRTDIIIAVKADRCSAWAGAAANTKSALSPICTDAVVSGTAGTTSFVEWGHITSPFSGTVTSNFYEYWVSNADNAGLPALAAGCTESQLDAPLYPSRGFYQYLTGGLYMTTYDGPARKGDLYTIARSYQYPVSKVFTAVSGTPQVTWRSEPDIRTALQPEVFLPLALDSTLLGAADTELGSALVALHLANINFLSFQIERYDTASSAWVNEATVQNQIVTFSFNRRGASLVCSTASGAYFALDELKDCRVKLDDGAGNIVFRLIRSNAEGVLSTAVTKAAAIHLDDVANTDPTSGTATIISSSITTVIEIPAGAAAYGLRILSQQTRENYFEIGSLLLGRVVIPGREYSRGRSIEFEAAVQTDTQQDGITRTRSTGKGKRTLEIAWTDGVDTSQLHDGIADPDYLLATTGSPSTSPAAALNDVPDLMMGLAKLVNGAAEPVVYLPAIVPKAYSGSRVVWTFNRYRDHMLCRLVSDVSYDNVVGSELEGGSTGEVLRVASCTFEECI